MTMPNGSDTDKLIRQIKDFSPDCVQEQRDKEIMLRFAEKNPDCLLRSNGTAHFTASAWIVNRQRTKVLFVYHRIYDSWSWVGGHADGEPDLAKVALKEAREETGITCGRLAGNGIFSLEILTVEAHVRKGEYVAPHLHFNLTYLVEADENEELTLNEDETKGVKWFYFADALNASSEEKMKERVYKKLLSRT